VNLTLEVAVVNELLFAKIKPKVTRGLAYTEGGLKSKKNDFTQLASFKKRKS
jgi:hypothetical protein